MFDWTKLQENGKEMLSKAKEKLGPMAESAKQKTDAAAETLAGKMSEWTGKEVTPGHVKKVAVISAAVVIGMHMLNGMSGAGAEYAASGGTSSGYEGFDNSFEGQTNGFFADKGGLNIETHTVDMDGVMLD